jgi:hypothetical protein
MILGWEKHISKKIQPGKTYYRHIPSLLTQWDFPTVSEEIQPRALRWVANSCYLDSILFAFFAANNFVESLINTNLDEQKDQIEKEGICGKDSTTDIVNRTAVQKELKSIFKSVTRKGPEVEFCTNLRKTLKNCPVEEKYHSGNTGDSGEFMEYLLNIFSTKKTTKKTITYATNKKGLIIDKEKLIREGKLIKISEKYDYKGSIIITIVEHIVAQIPKHGVKLSKFLTEEDDMFVHETIGKKSFKRRIQIKTIENAPYLIFNIKRLVSENPRKFISYPFYPDEYILVGKDKFFTLSSVVMHTGECHYVAVAKYGNIWYYYNDIDYLHTKKLIPFKNFNEFVENATKNPKSFINPLTHGTQYFYKLL